jgi:hypothetical protein
LNKIKRRVPDFATHHNMMDVLSWMSCIEHGGERITRTELQNTKSRQAGKTFFAYDPLHDAYCVHNGSVATARKDTLIASSQNGSVKILGFTHRARVKKVAGRH